MEKSTLLILCCIGFSIGFVAFWFFCKEAYEDFFKRKDKHKDSKTHYIRKTVRNKNFKNKFRAVLYLIRQSILTGIVGAIFLIGGVSLFVSQCSSNHSSSYDGDDEYEYFDDAHRPDHF